jgi:hypothetical protein
MVLLIQNNGDGNFVTEKAFGVDKSNRFNRCSIHFKKSTPVELKI